MMEQKYCFCFDLKYGFLAFGTLKLTFRLCLLLYIFQTIIILNINGAAAFGGHYIAPITLGSGWMLSSIFALYVALKGIIQDRFILLYPYSVILVVEIIILIVYSLANIVMGDFITGIIGLVAVPVNVYTYTSLRSLFKQMRPNEKKDDCKMATQPISTIKLV